MNAVLINNAQSELQWTVTQAEYSSLTFQIEGKNTIKKIVLLMEFGPVVGEEENSVLVETESFDQGLVLFINNYWVPEDEVEDWVITDESDAEVA